jgi:hypothetical protein
LRKSGQERPINWERPNASQLGAMIRFNAREQPEHIFFEPHALERQTERSAILDLEAWEVLRKGYVYEEPEAVSGGWMVRMEYPIRSAGRDAVALVEIYSSGGEFLVTTVMWKDV